MPYSGQTFSIVNQFIPSTTIQSSAVNQNFTDIASNGLSVVMKINGDSTMTGVLKAANGSVSAPSITFGSDTNLGFYRGAADQLNVTANGALVGYFGTSGYVAYSSDAGATVGPVVTLYRDSATPAASDIIGQVLFTGEDSAGNTETYASIQGVIVDPTSTSEDAQLGISTVIAGTVAQRVTVGAGVVIGSATGGDQGAGTLNATAVYDDGVQIFAGYALASASGLIITNNSGTPTTQIDLDAGVVIMVGTSNRTFIKTALDVTINAATTGVNALDAGALANSTWYYVWAIYNPTTSTTADY